MSRHEEIFLDYLIKGSSDEPEFGMKIVSFLEKDPHLCAAVITKAVLQLEGENARRSNLASCNAHLIRSLILLLEKEKGSFKAFLDQLSMLVMNLDVTIRPMLLREGLSDIGEGHFVRYIIERMSHEDMVKTIIGSIKAQESPDDTRALTLFLAPSPDTRRNLIGLFEKELLSLGISAEEYSKFFSDTLWRDLTLSEKAQILLKEGVLGIGDPEEVISVLRELLSQNESQKVELILNKFVATLEHRFWQLRKKIIGILSMALDCIGEYDSLKETYDKLIDFLCERLEDESIEVRKEALHAIATPGNKRILPHIVPFVEQIDLFTSAEERGFRRDVIEALGNLGCDDVLPLLTKILTKKQLFIFPEKIESQIAAIKALGKIGTKTAYQNLVEISKSHPHEAVRKEAITIVESLEI